MGERMTRAPAPLLLGRRTYEDFFSFWPKQTDNPYTEVLDNTEKYVASTDAEGAAAVEATPRSSTATPPRRWPSSKQQPGNDFAVLGSGQLVQSLMQRGLVDEFVLMIHPLVLGHGSPSLHRRRRVRRAPADRRHDDHHRRRDRHVPARKTTEWVTPKGLTATYLARNSW